MTLDPDVSTDASTASATLDGWLKALDQMFKVPAPVRDSSFPRAATLEMMNDDGTILDQLIAHGLPHVGPPGDEKFDRHEILNVALYSGAGTTQAEQAIRYASRWMAEEPETWFREKTWDFLVEVNYPNEADSAAADARLRIAIPKPEVYGGYSTLSVSPHQELSGLDVEIVGAGQLSVSGQLVSRGEQREIVSPVIRELVGQFSEGYLWTRMAERAQYDYKHVLASGYAPCIVASLALLEDLQAAGYQVRTRRGWLLGMLDLAHSWIDVIDDDGHVKVIDPAFVIIAKQHAEKAHPDFTEACMGSVFNRVLATDHTAMQPLLSYRANGLEALPRTRTSISLA